MQQLFMATYLSPVHGFIYINLDSKIAPTSGYPGDEEETMEAYILVRRRDDDEGNKVI
jgi:hypothetical protein